MKYYTQKTAVFLSVLALSIPLGASAQMMQGYQMLGVSPLLSSTSSIPSIPAGTSTAGISGMVCPVVSSAVLKRGNANSKAEIIRLQTFLKDVEKLDVEINGTFDQKTEDAVKAFQKKYSDVILAPWGATKASGVVSVTTGKKINQIGCGGQLLLNDKDLKFIGNYKGGMMNGTSSMMVGGVKNMMDRDDDDNDKTVSVEAGDNVVTTTFGAEPEKESKFDDMKNGSSSERVSIRARFWNFIVGLFKGR